MSQCWSLCPVMKMSYELLCDITTRRAAALDRAASIRPPFPRHRAVWFLFATSDPDAAARRRSYIDAGCIAGSVAGHNFEEHRDT